MSGRLEEKNAGVISVRFENADVADLHQPAAIVLFDKDLIVRLKHTRGEWRLGLSPWRRLAELRQALRQAFWFGRLEQIVERINAGIAAARDRGAKLGRPRTPHRHQAGVAKASWSRILRTEDRREVEYSGRVGLLFDATYSRLTICGWGFAITIIDVATDLWVLWNFQS